jgi:hypothetical protein
VKVFWSISILSRMGLPVAGQEITSRNILCLLFL